MSRAKSLKSLRDEATRAGWGRWIQTEADERALRAGYTFSTRKAQRVRCFFSDLLKHSKGEFGGQPFALLDWQYDEVIAPLFGWLRPDGRRRFTRAYIEIPKKNGKSTLAAGLAIYFTVADGERGAEVYSAAVDREQAGIVYREAASMVETSAALKKELRVMRSTKRILHHASASKYEAISGDAYSNEGLNISALIFDELHAQKNREFFEAVMYGTAARAQPMFVMITTAGHDRQSICWEQHDYAAKVLDGTVEDLAYFGYVRAAEAEDDWTDPKIWGKANPSLGVTIREEEMAERCREAQESPRKENAFRRYRLNQWTEQSVRWLPMEQWDACAKPFDPRSLAGRDCYAGLDLANKFDVTAFVLLFPDEGGVWVLPYFWIPRDTALQRAKQDRVPYDLWLRDGVIEGVPGGTHGDYSALRNKINELNKIYAIREIAVDPWNATQLCSQLMGDGFEVVTVQQSFARLSAPSKEFESLVRDGKLFHGGHPVLRWMASNVATDEDGSDNIKPSKKRSYEKIDGIAAAVNALSRAMLQSTHASVYEDRGLFTL